MALRHLRRVMIAGESTTLRIMIGSEREILTVAQPWFRNLQPWVERWR